MHKIIYVLTIFFIIYAYNPMFGSAIGFRQGLIDSLRSLKSVKDQLDFLDMYVNAPEGTLSQRHKAFIIELKKTVINNFKQYLIDNLRSLTTYQEKLNLLNMYINAPEGALTREQKAIVIELKKSLLRKRV